MQLRHLRYFIAVAEEGSVLKAARRLHVAQPSISKQIHDLEREVGCRLFERLARGVRLTPPGVVFLDEARRAIDSAARAVERARRAGAGDSQPLQLGLAAMVYHPAILSRLLSFYRARYPQYKVRVRLLGDKQQHSALRNFRIGAGIDWVVDMPVQEFATLALVDTAMEGVILPAAHPLARTPCVSLADLKPLVRLHRPRRTGGLMYNSLRAALVARGLDPVRHRSSPMDPGAVIAQIATGDAYVISNREMSSWYVDATDTVVYRPFIEDPIPMWLTLFWREDEASAAVVALANVAAELTAGSAAA